MEERKEKMRFDAYFKYRQEGVDRVLYLCVLLLFRETVMVEKRTLNSKQCSLPNIDIGKKNPHAIEALQTGISAIPMREYNQSDLQVRP